MTNLSEIFIRRPVMTTLIMLGILVFGLGSYRLLSVSDLPNVDFPTIQVSANLPGASPETMAAAVATPLEQQFSSIAGISSMNSSSSLGSTQVTLQFELSRDIDGAAQDVQSAIAKAARQLPATMTNPPSFRKVNPADSPILYISLSSEVLPLVQVNKYAETELGQRLSMIDGVAQVNIFGTQKYAVRVQLDPQALSSRGIGLEEVADAINKGNVNIPTGTLYGEKQNATITTNGQLQNAAEFRSLIVAYRNGAPVPLGELGQVIDGVENDKVAAFYNGTPGILLAIQRQPGTNTVKIVERIKELLPDFQKQLPAAINLNILFDRSAPIKEGIEDVEFTLLLTIGLVILVIFLFLRNVRATIIPSLAVPLSLIATFGVMLGLGYSLNNLSLMALTLAVGFVVDDAVVMLENIVRHMEMGESPWEAAMIGSREIGFTILSMTISLVAVFIPVVFMGGILGRLFREFAVTMSVAILISGFISLSLTPMLCSRFLRPHRDQLTVNSEQLSVTASQGLTTELPEEGENTKLSSGSQSSSSSLTEGFRVRVMASARGLLTKLYNSTEWVFDTIQNLYGSSLKWSLKHHRLTMIFSGAILVGTIALFMIIPKGFIPNTDIGQITATVQAAPDISFSEMMKHQGVIAKILEQDENIAAVNSTIGSGGINSGRFFIRLKPRNQRKLNADQVVQELRPKVSRVPGLKVFLQNPPAINIGGQQTKAQYQLTLQGTNIEELYAAAPKLETQLRQMADLQDVNSDLQLKNPQIKVEIDRDQAATFGLTANQIQTTLNNAYSNRQVSTIYATDNQYSVLLGLAPQFQEDQAALNLLSIRGINGQLIPLSTVAKITKTTGPLTINHLTQLPSVTLSFNLKPGIALGDVTSKIEELAKQTLPAGVTTSFQGSAQAFQDSLSGLGWLLLAAIIVIYIVLGILYENFIHPLTILSSLPSAGFGALLTLMIFQVDLNIYAFVGIILLIGIVKKNGIMMVDFAITARSQGDSPYQAIYQACLVRFRPIMMTTMAALMGTLPIALGLGAGADARRPLGLAVVGGLLFSQFLTLYLTPVFYTYMESWQEGWHKHKYREDLTLSGLKTLRFFKNPDTEP
jgi:hydrophobic/amphiphilic exporter-1 (mainly G- bacteria), HAE1 family